MQHGNTCRELRHRSAGLLFIAAARALRALAKMESTMRMWADAGAVGGMLACGPGAGRHVPPFKGNDTGGIIA